jgi:hypothetical protein
MMGHLSDPIRLMRDMEIMGVQFTTSIMSENKIMFDLSAPIIPGKSAAGIKLGQPIDEITRSQQPTEIHSAEKVTKYCFNQVDIWVEDGRVQQIGVKRGYQGSIQSIIGIGATISEVQLVLGTVIEDEEDNLIVPSLAGWCFDTDTWKNGNEISDNLDSRITNICVFAVNETP